MDRRVPLIIADSGFDFPGIATMHLNLQQARSVETQHFNVRRKTINLGWRQPLLWDYFTFARDSGAVVKTQASSGAHCLPTPM
jgi:hypothetical protein